MDEKKQIEQREGALSFARIAELQRQPVEGKFDAAHLREIHRRIFQDQPHHTPGEYRPDAPAHVKARALEHSGHRYHVHYAPRSQVDAGIETALTAFGGPDSLRGLNADQFSARMAKLYGDLDYLHPFKEGNSRTLRAFTSQLAREAGYELNWNATNADAVSRDRLYIARDKEVMKRAFPGLDEARAMKTDSRDEYEAYTRFVEPFAKAATLDQLIKEGAFKRQDLDAAQAFKDLRKEDALKKNPDLAGSYAKLAIIERKVETDGIPAPQRAAVIGRVRDTLAANIERGERPVQAIKEPRIEAEKDESAER